ncbi:hypothetical protein G6O69_37625 [Pseudenhygromyxa sp. WMMC2535]|uniref:hypothetical protein n=1 Tax=Pseudenhygromyxa sp. WMMC2535 TaxID=2712867 RepID=UPI00159511F4|nr:hypothetical protein [Pseudenhygromyxa sp. WMMC2535]NVB43592.1 hypothetical protein [Pseudenhygromyxa sp. WMMC2535]
MSHRRVLGMLLSVAGAQPGCLGEGEPDDSSTLARDDETLLECDESTPYDWRQPTTPPSKAETPRPTTLEPRPLRAEAATGPAAYFNIDDQRLLRLDGEGWREIWSSTFRAFVEGRDGELYLHDDSGIHRLAGAAFSPVLSFDDDPAHGLAAYEQLAVGPRARCGCSTTISPASPGSTRARSSSGANPSTAASRPTPCEAWPSTAAPGHGSSSITGTGSCTSTQASGGRGFRVPRSRLSRVNFALGWATEKAACGC